MRPRRPPAGQLGFEFSDDSEPVPSVAMARIDLAVPAEPATSANSPTVERIKTAKVVAGVCEKTAAAGGPHSPGLLGHYRAVVRGEPVEWESERDHLAKHRDGALARLKTAREAGGEDAEALGIVAECQRKMWEMGADLEKPGHVTKSPVSPDRPQLVEGMRLVRRKTGVEYEIASIDPATGFVVLKADGSQDVRIKALRGDGSASSYSVFWASWRRTEKETVVAEI